MSITFAAQRQISTDPIRSAELPPVQEQEKDIEPRWYAVYTYAHHEHRVAQQFGMRGVEHFLATYSSVRRWKDRRVTLEMPLFPGYVFVRIASHNRFPIVQVAGVARLVGFDGRPASLPNEEIDALRMSLERGVQAKPHPFLAVGRRVRVKNGPLSGLTGILLRRRGKFRIVISVELIQRALAVEMEQADVEPII